MCIIIDANVSHTLFIDGVGKEIFKRILDGKILWAVGGKLTEELYKSDSVRRALLQCLRSGVARSYSCDTAFIGKPWYALLTSDDPHVIELAINSGCRLLYSLDNALIRDFKNKDIVNARKRCRGKVIRSDRTMGLLNRCPACH